MSCITPFAGDSFIHRADPRLRVSFTFCVAMLLAFCSSRGALVSGLVAGVVFCICAKLPFMSLAKRLLGVNVFLLMLVVLLPFSYSGYELFFLFGYGYSLQGLYLTFSIVARANAVVLILTAMVSTMEAQVFAHTLDHLHLPRKLTHLLFFSVRYIEVIFFESRRLSIAMKVRGFRPAMNFHTYKSYGYFCGMLIVNSIERSERVAKAMKCRGYRGMFPLLNHFHGRKMDLAFGLCLMSIIILIAVLEACAKWL